MSLKRTKIAISLVVMGMALSLSNALAQDAKAQNNNAILDLLVKKGVISQKEATDAREQVDAQESQAFQNFNKVKTSGWLDSVTLYGDFRLRADYGEYEANPTTDKDLNADRLRWRYRLRVGADFKAQDWATIGVRLSSGEQGNNSGLGLNPQSANQTMGDDFSRKPIGIDLAYVKLTPPQFDYIKLYGGKMPNPIWAPKYISSMVWDPDVNPEGLGEQVEYKFGDKEQFRVFANAGQFVLNEISNSAQDVYLYDQQIGLQAKLNDHWKATVAAGYLTTRNLAKVNTATGGASSATVPVDDSPAKGNATTAAGNYLDDFQVAYGRGEIEWTINDQKFLGTPNKVTVSGEYLENVSSHYSNLNGSNLPLTGTTRDKNQTQAWTAQVAYGDNQKQGQWRLAYQYKVMQADATLDMLTDYSIWGPGGTDRSGHAVELSYQIRDWWTIRTATTVTSKISDRPNTGHNTSGYVGDQFVHFQLDTVFKF